MLTLRLNPTKTQVMRLGSGQQLKHVDTAAEPDQDPGHVARVRTPPRPKSCGSAPDPTKTQVMWLGSGQQLKHVDTSAEPDQDPGYVARLWLAAEAC